MCNKPTQLLEKYLLDIFTQIMPQEVFEKKEKTLLQEVFTLHTKHDLEGNTG